MKQFKPQQIVLMLISLFIAALFVYMSADFVMMRYHYWNGYFKQNQANYSEAISAYDQALVYDEDFLAAYLSRGSAYLDIQEREKALQDYNMAASIAPRDARVYAYRGRVHYELELFGKAMADYDTAIVLDEKMAFAYYNRGLLKYTEFEDPQGGCADFETAVKLGHDQASDMIEQGYCNFNLLMTPEN